MKATTIIVYIVEQDGKTSEVKISANATVAELWDAIIAKGISLKSKSLKYKTNFLGSQKRLSDYGITSHEKVFVSEVLRCLGSPGFQLSVVLPTGVAAKVVVHSNNTILSVKAEVSGETNIPIGKQKLRIGDTELADERKLKDYGINGDAIVFLETKKEARKVAGTKRWKNVAIGVVFSLIFVSALVWAYMTGRLKLDF